MGCVSMIYSLFLEIHYRSDIKGQRQVLVNRPGIECLIRSFNFKDGRTFLFYRVSVPVPECLLRSRILISSVPFREHYNQCVFFNNNNSKAKLN